MIRFARLIMIVAIFTGLSVALLTWSWTQGWVPFHTQALDNPTPATNQPKGIRLLSTALLNKVRPDSSFYRHDSTCTGFYRRHFDPALPGISSGPLTPKTLKAATGLGWTPLTGTANKIDFTQHVENAQNRLIYMLELRWIEKPGRRLLSTGSFSAWNPEGYPLADPDGDRVYTATLPVEYHEGEPVAYKYRMLSAENQQLLPNEGWESRPNRLLAIPDQVDTLSTGFVAFNDHRRIARFVVDISHWKQEGTFRPERGDILQLKLSLDGNERIAASFDRVGPAHYETAVQIPLEVSEIAWKLVKNVDEELTEPQLVSVPLQGAQFYWPSSQSFTSKK